MLEFNWFSVFFSVWILFKPVRASVVFEGFERRRFYFALDFDVS